MNMVTERLSSKARRILIALAVVIILLFALNLLHLYVGLEGMAFWGYPYVSSFFQDPDNPIKMKKITCPIFIGPNETKQVSISLTNTSTVPKVAYFQSVVSSPGSKYDAGYLLEEVSLLPHETRNVTFDINESNFVRNRYVVSRSFVSWQPVYVSNRSIACHPVVIDFFGLPSGVVGYGIFTLLILITALMAILFFKNDPFFNWYKRPRSSFIYLLSALTLMTIGSLTGNWLISFLMLVMIILGFLAFWQVNFQ